MGDNEAREGWNFIGSIVKGNDGSRQFDPFKSATIRNFLLLQIKVNDTGGYGAYLLVFDITRYCSSYSAIISFLKLFHVLRRNSNRGFFNGVIVNGVGGSCEKW